MKTILLTAAIALAASFPVGAHELNVSETQSLPVSQVSVFHSVAGEGLTAFIKRIAPDFAAYTEKTGHEACGVVAVTTKENDGTVDGAFSVAMGSIGSQVACANGAVEEGYTSMGRTIHSHPQKRNIRLTALDMKARGTPAGKLRTESVNNCEFSEQDYNAPGYLVTCGKVLTQSGRGTAKEL
ncbi:hypothetical protein AAY80_251 [Stenotrophomonas phage vB_SmaS-DLP_6]|nr:hypothetical protein AAY80_251 [Stenotrophomonas phage vB_SmaS-DLP_6]